MGGGKWAYTSHNSSYFAIVLPKIIKIGGNLTKFWQKKFCTVFLRHGVVNVCRRWHCLCAWIQLFSNRKWTITSVTKDQVHRREGNAIPTGHRMPTFFLQLSERACINESQAINRVCVGDADTLSLLKTLHSFFFFSFLFCSTFPPQFAFASPPSNKRDRTKVYHNV